MEFMETALRMLSVITANDQTILGVMSFIVVVGGGFYLKFKKFGVDKATAYSDIDEKRFNQLTEQLDASNEKIREANQETEFLTMERDHYRSKVRDLLFNIKQVRWMYDKHQEDCDMVWPIDDLEELEKSMVSPLEIPRPNRRRSSDSS